MNPHDKSSVSWKYTKGMALSYLALATAIITAGAITSGDLIKELDRYINIFKKEHSDSIEIIETIELVKDGLLKLYPPQKPSNTPPLGWITDFIGHA